METAINTIITVTSDSDFWTVAHRDNRAMIVGAHCDDEEGDHQVAANLVEATLKFAGKKTAQISFEAEFKQIPSSQALVFGILSPEGKVYSHDCKGEALRSLLASEPNAILVMAKNANK